MTFSYITVKKLWQLTGGRVSHYEVKKLFEIRKGSYLPCGLNFKEKLWWRFIPGETVKVKWPDGWTKAEPAPGGGWIQQESSDPNDHYRPWLEKHVGRQGWDWNWGMADNDVTENKLTIKIRRKHARFASMITLLWA